MGKSAEKCAAMWAWPCTWALFVAHSSLVGTFLACRSHWFHASWCKNTCLTRDCIRVKTRYERNLALQQKVPALDPETTDPHSHHRS